MGGSSLAGELPWSIVDPSTLLNARGDARERMRVAARGAISAAYARAPGACGARAARARRLSRAGLLQPVDMIYNRA
jgi:hypothetical protein